MNIKYTTFIVFILASACGADPRTSGVAGSSAEELRAEGLQSLAPQMARLAKNGVVEVNLFFTPNELSRGRTMQSPGGYRASPVFSDGVPSVDSFPATGAFALTDGVGATPANDLAVHAFDKLKSWLHNPSASTADVKARYEQAVQKAIADFEAFKAQPGMTVETAQARLTQVEAELAALASQLEGEAASRRGLAFLQDSSVSPLQAQGVDHAVSIEGRGPSLPGAFALDGSRDLTWRVNMYVGSPESLAPIFGSKSANSIAMLNGHFDAHDASLAKADAGAPSRGAAYPGGGFNLAGASRVYGPALDSLKRTAKPDDYGIVVLNGCGSEQVDALFAGVEAAPGFGLTGGAPGQRDVVSMQGFSNYNKFPEQVSKFLLGLTNERGSTWDGLLETFEFNSNLPEAQQVTPVLRNRVAGNGSVRR